MQQINENIHILLGLSKDRPDRYKERNRTSNGEYHISLLMHKSYTDLKEEGREILSRTDHLCKYIASVNSATAVKSQ